MDITIKNVRACQLGPEHRLISDDMKETFSVVAVAGNGVIVTVFYRRDEKIQQAKFKRGMFVPVAV